MSATDSFGIAIAAMNNPTVVNLAYSLDAAYIYGLSEDETNSLLKKIFSIIEGGVEYA